MKKFLTLGVLLLFITASSAFAEFGGSAGVSYTATDGNYDTELFDGSANELISYTAEVYRKTDYHIVELSGKILYDENDDIAIAKWFDFDDKHTLNNIADTGLAWRTHLTWDRNDFTNIDDRVEASISGGYQFVHNNISVSAFGGAGVIYEDRGTFDVLAEPIYRGVAEASATFDNIKIAFSAEDITVIDDTDNYRIDAEGSIAYKITDNVSIRLASSLEYENTPPVGIDRVDYYVEPGIVIGF